MYFEIRFSLVIASEPKASEAISRLVGDCFGLTSFGLAMTVNLDSNDDNNKVNVKVQKNVPIIKPLDYIRLWACYEAKMIYNLGFPNNLSSNMAIDLITKIVENEISEATDCFKDVDVDDFIQFDQNVTKGNTKFTGEFYAKGSLNRIIKTWFPPKGTEQQVVWSGLTLLQYAISMNKDDKECLDILTKTARNMVDLYKSGMSIGIASVAKIPTLAYMQAIGIAK